MDLGLKKYKMKKVAAAPTALILNPLMFPLMSRVDPKNKFTAYAPSIAQGRRKFKKFIPMIFFL